MSGKNGVMSACFAFLLACVALTGARATITVGPGPVIGTDARGQVWHQEFQDWRAEHVRALDPIGDSHPFDDGLDNSRDIVAFYAAYEQNAVYFRVDLHDLGFGAEDGSVDVYVAIDFQSGGQAWLPDNLGPDGTQTDYPWEFVVCVRDGTQGFVKDENWNIVEGAFIGYNGGGYFNNSLDAVEFGITRETLVNAGWDGNPESIYFQPFTARNNINTSNGEPIADYIGYMEGNVLKDAVWGAAGTGRAKYAVITHANQSVNKAQYIGDHIYFDHTDEHENYLVGGFVRLMDTAEMLDIPINMHLSGSLLVGLLWAHQDPADPRYAYPLQDGPTFIERVKTFANNGPGSLIGGVFAEHIMPYFEGDVNRKSIEQRSELMHALFGLTEQDMGVMHTPERVIRSDVNAPNVNPQGPLTGLTFADIAASGYEATYLDEVTHLHWWFYPDEQDEWTDDCTCTKWAGWMGCQEEPYHHKLHKINGVYTFVINDREDQAKFGNHDGGMMMDTRYTLHSKAMHPDGSQLTIVFDDWEAYAGKSFASSTPNNNPDQIHNTLRWAANRPWIEIVNLKTVLDWAKGDPSWVLDHGFVTDKSTQTYEWLKRATMHSYDNWYYGHTLEESFFDRVSKVHADWSPAGMKMYGDLNTPGTLIRDTWDRVQAIQSPNLKFLAEIGYSAMIYETAWHDEFSNPDAYQSRNYQVTFDRQDACTTSFEGTDWEPLSGWAITLHGHIRHAGSLKDVCDWVQRVRSGQQGPQAATLAKDMDDDTLDEYAIFNNRVFLLFERWGGRLLKGFVYDPNLNGGDAVMVIGSTIANPSAEDEREWRFNARCSALKDAWSSGLSTDRYIDEEYAVTVDPQSLTFTSQDGKISKTITLLPGRDAAIVDYSLTPDVGTLYKHHGFGPGQADLIFNGYKHLERHQHSLVAGLRNTTGGAAFLVAGPGMEIGQWIPAQTGWNGRDGVLIETFETYNTEPQFRFGLAFSLDSAIDFDGDGMRHADELFAGTDPFDPDSNISIRTVTLEPGQIRIDVSTAPQRRFTLFYADELTPSPVNWIPLGETWFENSPDPTNHVFEDNTPGLQQRFYRMQVTQ